MRVHVYFNLRTKRWSIREPAGKVIGHAAYVELAATECRVQEGARQTVIRTRTRSVHAYVVGELIASGDTGPARSPGMFRVTYNPYRASYFHRADPSNPAPVCAAARMVFEADGSAWCE